MAFTAITLTDPDSGLSSVIMPRDGVTAMVLDVQPGVRAVEEERVGGPGTVDNTMFASAATAALSMRLWHAAGGALPEAFLDEIGALLDPGRRCVLVCSNDQWAADRQLTVRFDSKTVPVDVPWPLDLSVGWKVPAGVWEAADVSVASLNPLLSAGGTGLRFTAAPPDNYLTGQSATFEGGNGNWTAAGNCAIANDATDAHSGTASLKLTSTAAGDMFAASCTAGNVLTIAGVPCSAGDRLNVSAWFKALTSARSCQVGADFYDASGTLTGSVYDTGHAVTDSASAWTQAAGSVIAPAGSHRARLSTKVLATGAGAEAHRVDDPFIARPGQASTVAAALDWPGASASADTVAFNPGNAACWWTAELYGPCTGPKLANDTAGDDLVFSDSLILAAGEFVAVDARARTAFRNNDPSLPVLASLDFTQSAWWRLAPGPSDLRYHPSTAQAGAAAYVTYRPAWNA